MQHIVGREQPSDLKKGINTAELQDVVTIKDLFE